MGRDKPETAAYACEECESVIEESKKQWMLKHGEIETSNESKIQRFIYQNFIQFGVHGRKWLQTFLKLKRILKL